MLVVLIVRVIKICNTVLEAQNKYKIIRWLLSDLQIDTQVSMTKILKAQACIFVFICFVLTKIRMIVLTCFALTCFKTKLKC